MSPRLAKPGFARRPGDPEAWVRAPERTKPESNYTARLTVDVSPALRGRIKIAAFGRGLTATDMLRALLEREFPPDTGASGTPS